MIIDNFNILHLSAEKGYASCEISNSTFHDVGVTFVLDKKRPTFVMQCGKALRIAQFSSMNAFTKWEEIHGHEWSSIERIKVPVY